MTPAVSGGDDVDAPACQEVAWSPTDDGELTLRRSRRKAADCDEFELWLDDRRLVSSRRARAEREAITMVLGMLPPSSLDIALVGAGLGCGGAAVLAGSRTRSLLVVEPSEAVAEWHRAGLLPPSAAWGGEGRVRLVHVAAPAIAAGTWPEGSRVAERRYDAVLLDLDAALWPEAGAANGSGAGVVAALKGRLRPHGVLAIWSSRELPRAVLRPLDGQVSPSSMSDESPTSFHLHAVRGERFPAPTTIGGGRRGMSGRSAGAATGA